jgi:3'-phosphoadenosine 5'-phosphosulfate sulfotransferase (PAPS reductase)/FAD synthetase
VIYNVIVGLAQHKLLLRREAENMNTLSRFLIALHFAKLDLRFKAFSRVIVSLSGGKDSALALLYAIEEFGVENVIAHYQLIPEDHPGTLEHCQLLCAFFGIPLYVSQMNYYAMVCRRCGSHHITREPETCWCHKCKAKDQQIIDHAITSIHGLIEWRAMYPDMLARFCTAWGKREVFNTWCRQNEDVMGEYPLMVSGERWAESASRAKLPVFGYRKSLREKSEFMLEYRPIIHLSRREVFCQLRDAGVPLHPCYEQLWREMLKIEHEDWRTGHPEKNHPHVSFPGQWDGLRELEVLPDELLAEMIYDLMYEVNEEHHGPRCSCADCVFFSELLHRASYRLQANQGIYSDALRIARSIPHKITPKKSMPEILRLSCN